MTGQITGDLKNWWFNEGWNVYNGNIYNDTKNRWCDGTCIHTSNVENVDEYNDCFIVTTRNSVYRLYKCDEKEEVHEAVGSKAV